MNDDDILPRMVACAAIRRDDGAIICGPRHFDEIMGRQIQREGGDWRRAEQGFVDQRGVFLSRREAYFIAGAARQIRREQSNDGTLYSECLY